MSEFGVSFFFFFFLFLSSWMDSDMRQEGIGCLVSLEQHKDLYPTGFGYF